MTRTCVVTGSASGIGRATVERLERDGHHVIGVDLHDAAVAADLATPEGRSAMVEAVTEASGGTVDVVVANAGTVEPVELCVRVNYFGAVATLRGLRPLLARSAAPRAVVTASSTVVIPPHVPLVEACLADDEETAVAEASVAGLLTYPSTKRAIARWVRRNATTAEWAGAGISLNAVGPGIVETPLTRPGLADAAMAPIMEAAVPMPFGGHARPEHVAHVMAFLTSPDTERLTGQVLFVDAGADPALRGDDVW